ncbi:MAG: hypothetical protein ACHQDD_05375 [Steroidobacterales bacterium]
MRIRAGAVVLGLTALAMLRIGQAADDPVDDGLLEFLGSVDSEDKDWHDYLAGTDIDQVARRATAPGGPPPAAGAPPPTPPPQHSAPPDSGTPGGRP